MTEYKINGYTVQSKSAYEVLKKNKDLSEATLKKADKNNDKILTEDELVEVAMADDSAQATGDNEETDNSKEQSDDNSTDNSTSGTDNATMKQISYYEQENKRLREKIYKLNDEIAGAKDTSETDSFVSQLNQYQSQIDANCNQVYKLLVSKEAEEAQNAKKQAATAEAAAASATTEAGTAAAKKPARAQVHLIRQTEKSEARQVNRQILPFNTTVKAQAKCKK